MCCSRLSTPITSKCVSVLLAFPMRFSRSTVLLFVLSVAAWCWCTAMPSAQRPRFDVLIINGRIVDGTGAPWFRADLGIVGDRIAALGSACGIDGRDHAGCDQPRRGARFHRSAGPVGVQHPRGRTSRQQDSSGRHDRDYRRGYVDRAAQRSVDSGRRGQRVALRRASGLAHARRLFPPARAAVASGHQHRHLRRRRHCQELCHRQGRQGRHSRRARAE